MRFREFNKPFTKIVNEGARIQHAEDLVFFEGGAGARRALEGLKNLEKDGHNDVTIKWDGSPAIIFGRNAQGEFILTDKGGFIAKGYDGRPKTGEDLSKMLIARMKGKPVTPDRQQFAEKMGDLFNVFEKAFDKSYEGFFKGDLLYYTTPQQQDGSFVFKPQIVTYKVSVDSKIGQQIAKSTAGVVVHRRVDQDGTEHPLKDIPPLNANVLAVPPMTAQAPVDIDDTSIKQLEQLINKQAINLDRFLDPAMLKSQKMSDLGTILYTYTNSKVDTGLGDLGKDFMRWLAKSKVTAVKQERIKNHILSNQESYSALWQIVNGIMAVKDDIIRQLDQQESPVKQFIGNDSGGEGYVLASPNGDIKLVPRAYFSKANRAVRR